MKFDHKIEEVEDYDSKRILNKVIESQFFSFPLSFRLLFFITKTLLCLSYHIKFIKLLLFKAQNDKSFADIESLFKPHKNLRKKNYIMKLRITKKNIMTLLLCICITITNWEII